MAAAARRFLLALPAVFGVLALAGCDPDANPVSPTPVTGPGSSSLVSLTIGGTTSLDRPGATGPISAIATFSDGTSRDVTAEAFWIGTEGWIAISGPGTITALRYGTGTVNARYLGRNASASIRIAPAGAFLMTGSVMGAGGFRLPGAQVESSSGCGSHSAIADEFGLYIVPAMGQAIVRVHVNGFRDLSEQMSVGTDGRHDFELVPVPQAGSLNGEYRLTVTASPSCVLPADIMQRRYDARVMEVERNLYVLLGGAALSVWGGQPGFTGTRDQSTVRFVVSATFDDGYNFIEQIDSERSLLYSGTAAGTADQSRIVATFSGTLELRAPRRGDAWCVAGDHRFELTRVPAQR